MIRLLADEELNNDILRALVRRNPDVDVLRVQDVGLRAQTTRQSFPGRPANAVWFDQVIFLPLR